MSKVTLFISKHLIFTSIFISTFIGAIGCLGWYFIDDFSYVTDIDCIEFLTEIGRSLLLGFVFGNILVLPILLTIIEIILMFLVFAKKISKQRQLLDLFTLSLGIVYSILTLWIYEVIFDSDWNVTLKNNELHTPIFTQARLTIIVLVLVGFAGYILVSFIPLKKMPPLILVTGIAAMYIGTSVSIIWGIQIWGTVILLDLYLLLLPLNSVIITARTVAYKMMEWKQMSHESRKIDSIPILRWCNCLLEKSEIWPIVALLLMWPLLGGVIAILTLFGQAPNSVITAWTETSDWNLSQRIAPQNIDLDEHYLCTVAAGGHSKVVKPIRLGVRHGHEVIVNRQLCVANAFEQIFEEKTPGFHRIVRRIYDDYGFPIAKLIHSKYVADLVYFLMKPLEWFFVIILYFTDVHPEDRIAIQYTGKTLKDFSF